MQLFLWHLTQDVVRGYDTYRDCVVCAPTEEAARQIHPSGETDRDYNQLFGTTFSRQRNAWPDNPALVQVRKLGLAEPGILEGVICASFRAG